MLVAETWEWPGSSLSCLHARTANDTLLKQGLRQCVGEVYDL